MTEEASGLSWTRMNLKFIVGTTRGEQVLVDLADYLCNDGMLLVDSAPEDGKNAQKTVENFVSKIKKNMEFGFGPLFDCTLIDACCSKGVFPMSIFPVGNNLCVFAPKLHEKRSVLNLNDHCISKSCRKRAKQYTVTMHTNMDDVLTSVVRHRGENWMCDPLRKCFTHMWKNSDKYSTKLTCICIWNESGELAASEAGYAVGDIYASLTGTTEESGAGWLQLAVLGAFLRESNFTYWDFGMHLAYKSELGAKEVPRKSWLKLISSHRNRPSVDFSKLAPIPVSCAEVLERCTRRTLAKSVDEIQAAKAAKLKKKQEKREKSSAWLREQADNNKME